MATAAFVQGTVPTIELYQIPAARGRAFWPRHEQELAADVYEAEHPGITVKRPWENEGQLAKRLQERARPPKPEPKLNMDPARAERELKRREAEIAALTPGIPNYGERFEGLAELINQLEAIIGREPTVYKKGVAPKKKEDAVDQALVEKLAKYKALSESKRRESIEKGTNVDLLALIRDNEADPALQTLAVQRIAQVQSVKAEPVTA